MITIGTARSGELTLSINGKSIHSKYDPVNEAGSFITKQSFTSNPKRFVLISPGLDYIKNSILKLYPHAKLLSIHLDKEIYDYTNKIGDNWIYGDNTTLFSKLENFIPDFLIANTNLIKWLPCAECFPKRTKEIEAIIHQFFLERRGTIFTTGNFGRKWLRNAYYNFLYKGKLSSIKSIDSPILIASSGPSLKASFKIIREYKDKYILAALPSSLAALNEADIKPDLILYTDPGFWAKEHLKHIIYADIPIIMPLTASFEASLNNPIIYINQETHLENSLLTDGFLRIKPHGTVAGTAYLFFRKITASPIIFLGLDFCFDDVKEHISPHSFDILYNKEQNRFNGYLNLLYEKQQRVIEPYMDIKTTKPFFTYSGWFNDESKLSNAYRFCPSLIKTKGLKDINLNQLSTLLDRSTKILLFEELSNNNNSANKRNIFNNLLEYIIELLDSFQNKIESIETNDIFNLFTKSDFLLEILQYTAYLEIFKLSHYYTTDMKESRNILNNIYVKSSSFIKELLKRPDYD